MIEMFVVGVASEAIVCSMVIHSKLKWQFRGRCRRRFMEVEPVSGNDLVEREASIRYRRRRVLHPAWRDKP
jgi:hypothetical protein